MVNTLGWSILVTKAYLIFNFLPCSCYLNIFFLTVPEKTGAELTSPQRLRHRGARVGRLTSAGTSLASWQPPCPVQVAVRPAFYSSLFLVD